MKGQIRKGNESKGRVRLEMRDDREEVSSESKK